MTAWINGRRRSMIDYRDRGLQYGDGLFETMRVHRGKIRLLGYHFDRLQAGCRRLQIKGPAPAPLSRELQRIAGRAREGIVKLIVTRGPGPRGYRPNGRERCTRIITHQALGRATRRALATPAVVRLCATPMAANPRLAGLKTLNRLDSVLARSEWRGARIWEGLMPDVDGNIVCGTMSNVFLKHGTTLSTPSLERCGVAGVMRRWILQTAGDLRLSCVERRVRWQDLCDADEVFMTNAVIGVRSVRVIERGRERLRDFAMDAAEEFRVRLDLL